MLVAPTGDPGKAFWRKDIVVAFNSLAFVGVLSGDLISRSWPEREDVEGGDATGVFGLRGS